MFIQKIVVISNHELIAFPNYGFDVDNNYHIVSDPILSSDGGQTWELIETEIPSDFYTYEAIEVQENNGNIIISSKGSPYSYGVQISTDYGRSFEEVYANFPEPSISIFGINVNRYSNIIYVCTSGYGVFRSIDGGFTWNYFETIEPLGRFCNFNVNQNSISSLAYWDHVAEYYDFESDNWFYLGMGSTTDSVNAIFPFIEFEDGDWFSHSIKASIADSGRRFSIIRSNNSGESWEEVGNSTYENIQSDLEGYFKCYFGENSSRLIWYEQATTALLVHTSLDTAQTWSSPSQFAYGSIVRSTVQTEDTVYALVDNSDDEGIYYSTDNCQTWQNTNFPSISSTRGILEMELDQETGILYTFSNRHCYSFDGSNWTQLGNVNSVFNIAVMPNGDSPIIVASGFNQYLHISTDGGNNWSRCDSLLPFSRQIGYIYKVKYDPWRDRIWISTSIGMMYAEREDLLSVDDPGSSFIPLGSNPIQAYPNPFNSSINITYTIELPGSVELKLFNLSGQEIASLYSGNINRGRYKLTYDASHLASGTYFLKLDEGGAIHTQKVTLIK